jgi:starch synthase
MPPPISLQELPVKVLFVSVEMSPLVKVGGLADVAGSLPKALRNRGLDVRVVLPLHRAVDRRRHELVRTVDTVRVPTPRGPLPVALWQGRAGGIPVYVVENAQMFDRSQVYGEPDDVHRWLFFCDAVLALLPHLDWRPDVVHLNDWHAAFIAARLRGDAARAPSTPALLYTIHNLALKGEFDRHFATEHHLSLHPPAGLEVSSELLCSGMAQGIARADLITTVSPTYAREILTPEYGAGLDPLLRQRASDLFGILNGIDDDEFNPATDPRLPAHFSADDLGPRREVRRALQRHTGLGESAAPVVGVVNRLFWQKGADIAVDGIGRLLDAGAALQFVVLGTGDQVYHEQLRALERRHSHAVKLYLEFNPDLAQLIYGGSDIFLMPSRYEPCGLGQMIAMRYGSVPVVRRTGGLADTVIDADEQPASGRGFVFAEPNGAALAAALQRAFAAYRDPPRWRAIQLNGMRADFSWKEPASRYADLYGMAVDRRAARSHL